MCVSDRFSCRYTEDQSHTNFDCTEFKSDHVYQEFAARNVYIFFCKLLVSENNCNS